MVVHALPAVEKRWRLGGIELLRFLLAFGVMLYHYAFGRTRAHGGAGFSIGAWGMYLQLCVETFFVISGFVIMESVAKRTAAQFAVARISRLGPVLLVGSTLTLLGSAAIDPGTDVSARYWTSVLVLPLIGGGGLDPSLWSLQPELIFYALIFVLALYTSDVQKHSSVIAGALLALPVFWKECYALMWQAHPQGMAHLWRDHPAINTVLTRGIAEFSSSAPWFAVGLALSAVYRGHKRVLVLLSLAVPLCALDAQASLQSVASIHHVPVPGRPDALVASAAIVALVGAAILVRMPERWASLYARLGAASFPLYVIHQALGLSLIKWMSGSIPPDAAVVIVGTGMVAVALFIAAYLEPPMARAYRAALTFRPSSLALRGD